MKMAKIQTPMKSLMLWLRSFDIFVWLLVNTVPITNTATEYRCHQRKVYIICKLTIKSFKIWIIIPMSFADKEKEYGCWYHGNEQCWNESWRHVSNSFFNTSMTFLWAEFTNISNNVLRPFLAKLRAVKAWKSSSTVEAPGASLQSYDLHWVMSPCAALLSRKLA